MQNKIALITGATAGIGEATALLFAQNGWDLILTGRRTERLQQLAEHIRNSQHKVRTLLLSFDVRNYEQTKKHLEAIPTDWQNIDVLVNNAGLAVGFNDFHEAVIDDWERMIDTNVKGLLYVSRLISPLMVERKKGHIINVSSIAGKQVYSKGNVYCATKHAVDALCKAMRIDLVKHKIRVTSINPGAVETEFSNVRFKGDDARADQVYAGYDPLLAEDVADTIYYAATRPPHVTINELIIMPTAQADSFYWNKEA